jgi:glycine/D-amino acid oxidase-like deaminating enzyme
VSAGSIWLATAPPRPEFPELQGRVRADVAVIGGGIVGITTALLAQEAGARVVLLEADRLAHGVSGHTTAKVTSQHGMIYAGLRSRLGAEAARAYGEANEAALAWIARRVKADGIDCDFRRRRAYAYVTSPSGRSRVGAEVEAAQEAGLPASPAETTPLPFPVEAAVRFDRQAEFHAGRYLLALAERLERAGCEIHERSRAVEVDEDEDRMVKTPGGQVTADRVVVATHYPFLDRSLAFARVHPQRSYAIACRIAGRPPAGMLVSGESPTRSVRAVPLDGDELLLVGGEGHRPGTGGDTEERYRGLEAFARRPRARRGRHRAPCRRARRRLPRRARRGDRRLADLHAPGLPGGLQPRRAQLGLPVPRLPVRARRRGPPGPGRAPARAQAARLNRQ